MENQKQNILIIYGLGKSEIKIINKYLTSEEGQKIEYIFIDYIYLKNVDKDNIKGLDIPIFTKKIFIYDYETKYNNIEIFKNISKIPFDCKIINLNNLYSNEETKDYKAYDYEKDIKVKIPQYFNLYNFNFLIDDFDKDNYNIIQIKETKIKINKNIWSFTAPNLDKDYYNPIYLDINEYYYKLLKQD